MHTQYVKFFPYFDQYIHGLAARGVHYLHRPGPTLQDVGFILLPVRINSTLCYILLHCYNFCAHLQASHLKL